MESNGNTQASQWIIFSYAFGIADRISNDQQLTQEPSNIKLKHIVDQRNSDGTLCLPYNTPCNQHKLFQFNNQNEWKLWSKRSSLRQQLVIGVISKAHIWLWHVIKSQKYGSLSFYQGVTTAIFSAIQSVWREYWTQLNHENGEKFIVETQFTQRNQEDHLCSPVLQ